MVNLGEKINLLVSSKETEAHAKIYWIKYMNIECRINLPSFYAQASLAYLPVESGLEYQGSPERKQDVEKMLKIIFYTTYTTYMRVSCEIIR